MGKLEKSTSTITFFFRYTSPVTGKRDLVTIGRFSEKRDERDTRTDGPATLAEARAERNRLEALVLQGVDPKHPLYSSDTLRAIATVFFAFKSKVLAIQTMKTNGSALNSKILPAFGDKRIMEIERGDVIRLLDSVFTNAGYEMMRQTKKTHSTMFSYAMDRK